MKMRIIHLLCVFSLAWGSVFTRDETDKEPLLSQPLTVRWRYESNVTLNLTPAFDNERIYLPLAGGTLVALKARDGRLFTSRQKPRQPMAKHAVRLELCVH
jgi:hypothetical protein